MNLIKWTIGLLIWICCQTIYVLKVLRHNFEVFKYLNITDIKYFIYRSYNSSNDYLRKVIPYDWCDKPELLRDILFAMIIDFVEKEKCFEVIDYSWDEEHRRREKEIKRLYKYCKLSSQQKEHYVSILLNLNNKFLFNYILNKYPTLKNSLNEDIDLHHFIIDTVIDEMENNICKRIVQLRLNLWT